MNKFLFILEMANNHKGSVTNGKHIIQNFYDITKQFPEFDFAFKFQRRNLENIIHPDFEDNENFPYLQKFKGAQLSEEELKELVDYAKFFGYKTICTPFDEVAVDEIKKLNLDYVKIGSCSILDWPLLNKIAELRLPVIASKGGITTQDVDKVVTFFQHRNIPLSLMHCIGLYPPNKSNLSLNVIDMLRDKYPNLNIGYSTHENPADTYYDIVNTIALSVAKGASIFEHHVTIDDINKYSLTPNEYISILNATKETIEKCTISNTDKKQRQKLNTFKRGAYLTKPVKAGDIITRDILSFYMPIKDDNHITAFDCEKYTRFIAQKEMCKNEDLSWNSVEAYSVKEQLQEIHDKVQTILQDSHIHYHKPTQIEISHHYGLDKFGRYGMSILNIVNEEYCKKLLIIFSGQENPFHYHKIKKETFCILAGKVDIYVNDKKYNLTPGDTLTIKPGDKHKIFGNSNAIIEEISSTHKASDSFYIDEHINNNYDRKTLIYL